MIKGVYCLTSPSGKRYVGIGIKNGVEDRWRQYKKLHCKNQRKLYNALKKYGAENFKYEVILETDDLDRANKVEKQLIALWNLQNDRYGYNITAGGDGNCHKHSEETKKKISDIRKNNPNRFWLGKKRSKETIEKISNTKIGKRTWGEEYIIQKEDKTWIVKDLKKFCMDNGLKYNSLLSVACGIRNSCHGYFIKKYKPNDK